MLTVEEHGEVIRFHFQRKIFGYCLDEVNAFLVDGLLIDTGPSTLGREMVKACNKYHLEQIVNTHHHEDHIGNNAILQRKFCIPVRAHREALPAIRQPRENLKLSLYQRFLWGEPAPAKARRVGKIIQTRHYRFRVIFTPGHSRDHICLYEVNRGWLFGGDLVCHNHTKNFNLLQDKSLILDSLKKIARFNISVLFCGSEGVVLDPGTWIQKRIEYLEKHDEISLENKNRRFKSKWALNKQSQLGQDISNKKIAESSRISI